MIAQTINKQNSLLIYGFIGALVLRLALGGQNVTQSTAAGIIFAACLYVYALLAGAEWRLNRKVVKAGLLGGLFLCGPAVLLHLAHGSQINSGHGYAGWALATSFVAFAEEAFLRGALYDSILRSSNAVAAILITSLLFAILHLPLYGWHALPLDFAVGLWLGALRHWSGSFVAPGIAHVIADLAGWWLY